MLSVGMILFVFLKMAKNRKNLTPDQFLGLKLDTDLRNILLHNSIQQIFDSFDFFLPRFCDFQLFFRGNAAIILLKIKKSKICWIELWRSMF